MLVDCCVGRHIQRGDGAFCAEGPVAPGRCPPLISLPLYCNPTVTVPLFLTSSHLPGPGSQLNHVSQSSLTSHVPLNPYSTGAPVDLIRNSALIGRFAQLHSAACHAANPDPAAAGAALYGPGLTAGDDGQSWTAAGDPELCKRIAEMELRLSNVTGVEVRGWERRDGGWEWRLFCLYCLRSLYCWPLCIACPLCGEGRHCTADKQPLHCM
jgi:hypothetical protein